MTATFFVGRKEPFHSEDTLMTAVAASLRMFSFYMLVVAALLLLIPRQFAHLFGLDQMDALSIRIIGALMLAIGYYYLRGAQAASASFAEWTVHGRLLIVGLFLAFVLGGLAPPVLLVFAAVDGIGAVLTWAALRKEPAGLLGKAT